MFNFGGLKFTWKKEKNGSSEAMLTTWIKKLKALCTEQQLAIFQLLNVLFSLWGINNKQRKLELNALEIVSYLIPKKD